MYSPSPETASKTVAVPKSTTITGPPYNLNAATASTTLSAPTSLGLSYKILTPVFIPAPTTKGRSLKYSLPNSSNTVVKGGTTLHNAILSTSSKDTPLRGKRLRISMAYSSGSLYGSLAIRQVAKSLSSSNTPIVTFVFPISIANNISDLPINYTQASQSVQFCSLQYPI